MIGFKEWAGMSHKQTPRSRAVLYKLLIFDFQPMKAVTLLEYLVKYNIDLIILILTYHNNKQIIT